MTPRKLSQIGLTPIGELMGERVMKAGGDKPGKIMVNQQARQLAMRAQGTVKVQAFPVGNRAARRLAKSRKAKEHPL